jgi:flagellar hook protein FlgE
MTINSTSMMSHQNLMNVTANNIANVNSKNFDAKEAKIENNLEVNIRDTNKPTDLTKEMTDMISTQDGFEAQAPVIKTEDQMMGTLLDMKA